MTIISNTIAYLDGETLLEGFIAYDDSLTTPRPAVLISHSWVGRDAFVMEKAQKIAELGYVGFALDMYGQGKVGKNPEENAQLMQPFIEDRALLQRRMQAALNAVKAQPQVDSDKVAAIGFCFGGLCVLDLARTGVDMKGAVAFHGLLSAPADLPTQPVKAKVLVLHGHDDPFVPANDITALQQELTTAGADWQFHSYGNTVHAFTNPQANDPVFGTVYNANADKRSWQSTVNFLAEIFS